MDMTDVLEAQVDEERLKNKMLQSQLDTVQGQMGALIAKVGEPDPRTAAIQGLMQCRLALIAKLNNTPANYTHYAVVLERSKVELADIDAQVEQILAGQ
jgi:hypothetical protein